MSQLWAAYLAALTLGAAHALEVDHMVAVSAFVGGKPRFSAALAFGMRWGIGHSVVVLVVGGLLAWSGLAIPAGLQVWAEGLVGVALIAVGVWAGFNAGRLHLHTPEQHGGHAHLHAHPPASPPGSPHGHEHPHPHPPHDEPGRHGHFSTMVGAAHGLAGTAPVVALIPVTLMPSLPAALGYLLAFGIGTTVAMSAYAGVAALAVGRAASSVPSARAVAFITAAASLGVGIWWLVRTFMEGF